MERCKGTTVLMNSKLAVVCEQMDLPLHNIAKTALVSAPVRRNAPGIRHTGGILRQPRNPQGNNQRVAKKLSLYSLPTVFC